jgi:hypothetical protein
MLLAILAAQVLVQILVKNELSPYFGYFGNKSLFLKDLAGIAALPH